MKKIITIIFTLALILCLAACGNDVPVEETQPKATVSDATKPEVAEPEATEPDVTEPDVTEPEATEPEVTDPPVTEKPHAHSYTSTTEKATCDKDGRKVFTCECGDSYTEIITKLGHSYTDQVTAPTCTENGYTTHTCTRCSDSYKDSYKDATNHSYTSKVTTAATCTKEGVKTFTCSKCANKYTESIAKTAHNYTAATCTKPKTCSCGATSGSALGHSYNYAKNKAPTTSATGTLKGTCSRCSGTTSVTVPKLNTTDYTRTQTKAPTCTATGTYTWQWKTTTYGTFSYTTSIAAKGHSWGSWEITNYPTPVLEGKQERVCNSCSKKETQTVAKSKYDGTYHSNNDYTLLSNKQKGTAGFNIRYAWWENGELKIDGYFFNDTKSTQIFNSAVRVKIYGRNGVLIADGTFNLSHIKLNAKETGFHQLTFGIDSYSSYGCDLSYLEWAY